jgi:hypothetical protein
LFRLHFATTDSEKNQKMGTFRKRGDQCTYDKAGNLITHGPAAGTPDLFGGNGVSFRLLDHLKKDVLDLNKQLEAAGTPTGGSAGFVESAILGTVLNAGKPDQSSEYGTALDAYNRTMNAIGNPEAILRYLLSRGGFYRPCVPDNAPENWGDWKFSDGKLVYTGAVPQRPAMPTFSPPIPPY